MPPRRRVHNYLLPFLVILMLVGAVVLVWWGFDRFLLGGKPGNLSEKVFLNIEAGSAKAMTVGKSEWQNAPDRIYLYRGEGLKTGTDGRVTLTYFEQSILRLNTNSEVVFSTLRKSDDSFKVQTALESGDAWLKVNKISNPDSKFSLTTDQITLDSRGGVFSVTSPGTVYCLEGGAQIGVKLDDEVVKTYSLGVGQQFLVDAERVASIKKGEEVEVIFALSDAFKKTNWYGWNAQKDGMIDAFEESGMTDSLGTTDTTTTDSASTSTDSSIGSSTGSTTGIANMDRVAYVTKPSPGFATSKSSFAVEGNYDVDKVRVVYVNGAKATMTPEGKWRVDSVKLLLEGENKIKLEAEDKAGLKAALEPLVVLYDKTPPEAPLITDPKSADGSPIEIETAEQIIKGTVSADTEAITINDYRLGKYVPGSKIWQYYAKASYGNLQAGENEFKVFAEDKAGNKSEPAILILKVSQEVLDKAAESTIDATAGGSTGAPTVNLPSASSAGGVKITAPNNGESFKTSQAEFEIAGTVPDTTAKVVVNDYTLSLYTAGSTSFKYKASKSMGSLEIGKQNTYTVRAYDADGKELGKASIVIDVESGAADDPVITLPTDKSTYSTTLDTLTLGGTVGKWVTRVYVNDKELTDYIPGSEKWSSTVKLQTGKNNFTVSAERSGTPTGKDSIEITFQQ